MSDLDENLTSILSSLIDTDGIETPNPTELADGSTFNGSRLDFENLASCITGSDASLHQSSDENVSSLLESHLNELAQSESTSIVEAATSHLDDVTPFDLDKPMDALLESEPSEFISHECPDEQLPIICKTTDIQVSSNELNTIQNHTLNELENVQSVLNVCNQKELANQLSQIEVEQSLLFNERPILNALDGTGDSGEVQDGLISNANDENQCNQPDVEPANDLDREVMAEENHAETIIADQMFDESLAMDVTSKHEVRKRRRILVYNDGDSDNSELEEERQRLLQSKSPTPSQPSNKLDDDNQNELFNDECFNQTEHEKANKIDDEDYIRDPCEKPGPKSKKQSTHLYNALKAKALLESAIVIPARKKKKRVIDSDDEFALNQPIASVDDIGLIPDDNNLMPFNVSIETEQKDSIDSVKHEIDGQSRPRIRVKNDLVGSENVDEKIKREPLSRSVTQAKMEKYHANYKRRSRQKKDPTDFFTIPLNAPYVDSSSDEDYFLPHNTNKKNQHHSQRWSNNGNTSSSHQRKKKGHIPDEIYFNAKVPLHVLYSYDDSSSDDEKKDQSVSQSTHSLRPTFQPTNRPLNKMPPVHKIVSPPTHVRTPMQKNVLKHPERSIKNQKPVSKSVSKPTVFEQLDKLKRLLRASGIKVHVNEMLKGSKTFQERCERIRDILYRNGIEGEPTMAKCKKLKKQLKLKEEIAGLDPSVIIESKEDNGRSKRTTRRATRRNYVYDEPEEAKKPLQVESRDEATQLLQKMKEFIDSDSEYEGSEHNQNNNSNSNSVDPANVVESVNDSRKQNASSEIIEAQTHTEIQTETNNQEELEEVPMKAAIENHSTPAQCTVSSGQL